MESKELRIGNYVWSTDGYFGQIEDQITEIEYKRVGTTHSKTPYLPIENVEPILLTEEWLLKFGFEKCDSYFEQGYSLGKYKSFSNSLGEINFCLFDFGDWYQPIKFVHQLQNLYFALTGEELTKKNNMDIADYIRVLEIKAWNMLVMDELIDQEFDDMMKNYENS